MALDEWHPAGHNWDMLQYRGSWMAKTGGLFGFDMILPVITLQP